MNDAQSPPLYRAEQVRELDRIAIQEQGIDGYELMCRAGAAAFAALRKRWPDAQRLTVLCGPGNNGGDGYVIAGLAREAGLAVTVRHFADPQKLKGAARQAWDSLGQAGVEASEGGGDLPGDVDVVVDAMLGTGLQRAVEGAMGDAIDALNAGRVPVLAVDIPSGLSADTGNPFGRAVHAALTVTFIGRKRGLYTGSAPDYTGEVVFDDLQVPAAVYGRVARDGELLCTAPLGPLNDPRPRTAHKGHNGHVLVVGGDQGTVGAVRMAGEAALRVGAGLVSVATRAAHATLLAAVRPELMAQGVERPADLAPLLERATVVAIGPGLGQGNWGRQMFQTVLASGRPLVVDADALNLLAKAPRMLDSWVLTPHPGEAGRLLGGGAREVQADRFAALGRLVARFGGTCVLKGAGTLIGDADGSVSVCTRGNPGMASGGMGDVLTGIIAGLCAQGLALPAAARAGVCVHGAAGDRAARAGERGLLASDLIRELRAELNA
ncbi:MAG: NAD(P)H-hydrate dehydratase [Gammaproteobacteria bacterium]